MESNGKSLNYLPPNENSEIKHNEHQRKGKHQDETDGPSVSLTLREDAG